MDGSIFRYRYPEWPPQLDGTDHVSQLGTFDFLLSDVLATLRAKEIEDAKLLHLSRERRTSFSLLQKTITRIQFMPQLGIVEWKHPSRDLSIEEKQRQNNLQSAAPKKQPFVPEHLEDLYLGFDLENLAYAKRFARVRCAVCDEWHLPEDCSIEDWRIWGSGGDKYTCGKGHTLLARSTMMISEALD